MADPQQQPLGKIPFSIANIMLCSTTGHIAYHPQESSLERRQSGFTCAEDFKRLRRLVASCDVVFHGLNSMETEQGAFRVVSKRRTPLAPNRPQQEPTWVIFCQSLPTSLKSPFWSQAGIPKWLFVCTSCDPQLAPQWEALDPPPYLQTIPLAEKIPYFRGNIAGLLQTLSQQGHQRAALLGGGRLNAAFWQHGLVDDLFLTLSPVVTKGDNLPALLSAPDFGAYPLRLKRCVSKGDFVYLDYSRR